MAHLLPQLLTESAARQARKTAVWARGRSLSYQELDESSNRLAWLLRDQGIRKGDRVGLYFPKAVESVVSMLGALKAGAVYVPIDPQSPPRRVAYILANCGVHALVTDRGRTGQIDPAPLADVGVRILVDDTAPQGSMPGTLPWGALARFPSSPPPDPGSIETDLAYMLYTSGSTGDPKGVMLSHRNALTFVDWCAGTFEVRPDDRLSNHAPLHFDLSVFDIYNAIGAGATVYMIDERLALFPADLSRFIEETGITVWYSVPSALVYLLLHGDLPRRKLDRLRLILFAGEVFPMKYLRQLAEVLPAVRLYNLYGPTETNVCTYHEVDRARLLTMDNLPIGRACANTEVFAVGEDGRPIAPGGEEGELYVRGPSVTPGYWGDVEKTARAVVSNQYQPHFREMVYRTGDLVTLDESGEYFFVGRRDSMIKSRGYRIELGDIEAALYSHPAVREAAAVAIPDEEVSNRIKAFVVLESPGVLTESEIQQHCAGRIPKYMIPELVEFRDRLPKTSTGKVDRKILATAR